jgi:signal transduction histidine kinase/CheY-like chemotaxis protein/HPt (histidine-containing phosphotransfer) domain-containing protein
MRRSVFLSLISLLLLSVGGGASYWTYSTERSERIKEAAKDLRDSTTVFVQAMNAIFEPGLALHETILNSGLQYVDAAERLNVFFALSTGPIQRYEQINGAFVGFPNGEFLHVQDLAIHAEATEPFETTRVKRLLGRVIDLPYQDPIGLWLSYDPNDRQWFPHQQDAEPYDPRTRPWYQEAVKAGGPVWTDTYIFASSGKLGVTYATPIYDENDEVWGVVGVDLSLESLSHTLQHTSSALVNADLVFATDLGDKVVGHPDFIDFSDQFDADTSAFLERYQRVDSVESILARGLTRHDEVETLTTGEEAFLAVRKDLDPRRAMPLHIYVGRTMNSILDDVIALMYRNMALVFFGVVGFGVVASYAVKLRVEVTAREKAEEDLIEARDVAEAATKAKSTFLATMSHEIRTPMNGVMSMAELLGLTRLDSEQRHMAKIITDSATALLTIINDILDFSKIEAGKLEIERVEFSLMAVVNGSAELLAPRAEAKGLDILVDVDPGLVDLRLGDPTRLRQILLNLGGNAVKFTETGRVGLKVTALTETDMLRFEVSDSGIGLTPEQRGKLFQPFVQADNSTSRKFGGTGLGLSICQRLTDLMGGRIGADSVIGEGSVFWFELPLDAIGTEAPAPDHILDTASVGLIGLSDELADIAARYLQAGGVTRVERAGDFASLRARQADLWIVACSAPGLDSAALESLEGSIALVGRRAELPEIAPNLKHAASILLSLPLSRHALWHAVAIGLGLASPDEIEIDIRDDMAFAPPPVEDARAAGALILVAEDNETNQIVIRQMLSKMGFACEIADNGRIALDRLDRAEHGLLLTDFNMPEMDGFELTRRIRAMELDTDSRLPIIALTADALAGTEEACLAAGMDDYLTKPIDSHKLGRALGQYLPAALNLRRSVDPAQASEPSITGPAPQPSFDWDPDIFDPDTLGAAFGGLDQEAKDLIQSAADAWVQKVASINTALEAGDPQAARDVAHALKGAALSVGAKRLGGIAADIQDFLDAGDPEMAAIMAEVLDPTLKEFQVTLPKIMQL